MAKVVFRPSGKTIECEVGDNLLEVARRADVYIEAPCNGSNSFKAATAFATLIKNEK